MENGGPIFISYSSKDNQVIAPVLDAIEHAGIPYWKAPEMIPAGSNYAKEIPDAIDGCSAVLFFVSRNAQASVWVEKEIESAINHRKKVIPVMLDSTELNDVYRFYLNNEQLIFYADNEDAAMRRLLEELKAVTENGAKKNLVDSEESERLREIVRRNNALTENKAPIACKFCGGALEGVNIGVYRCVLCGGENYDYFETVRRYLDKHGPTPAVVIENQTGVPKKAIKSFFNQEMLEIPSACSFRVSCSVCGKPIRTGTMCDHCKVMSGTTGKAPIRRDVWNSSRKH